MDKTLDMVALVHRLIIGVALALFLVGVTIQPPNSVYDDAEDEIQTLTNGITAISDQVDEAYKGMEGGVDASTRGRRMGSEMASRYLPCHYGHAANTSGPSHSCIA